jgi:hypothetical protein
LYITWKKEWLFGWASCSVKFKSSGSIIYGIYGVQIIHVKNTGGFLMPGGIFFAVKKPAAPPPEPFVPSGTPYLWFDADALLLNDNDPVTSWTDETGGGHPLDNGVPPTFKTNIQNGKPAVYFNNSWLGTNMEDLFQPNTVFIVCKFVDTSDGYVFDGDDETHRNALYVASNTIRMIASGSSQRYDGPAPDTDTHIITSRFDGASTFMRIDGVTVGSGAIGATVISYLNGFHLGAQWHEGGRKNMYVMEVLVYDGPEDPGANEAGLMQKWGITQPSAVSFTETFTGDNGDPPNTSRWATYNVTPEIQNNKCRITNASGSEGIYYKWELNGDIEITIEGDDVTYPSTNAWFTVLQLWQDGGSNDYIEMRRMYSTTNQHHIVANSGVATIINSNTVAWDGATPNTSWKFKIERIGRTVNAYYWASSQWNLLHTRSAITPTDLTLWIFAGRSGSNPTSVSDVDNVIVTADILGDPYVYVP